MGFEKRQEKIAALLKRLSELCSAYRAQSNSPMRKAAIMREIESLFREFSKLLGRGARPSRSKRFRIPMKRLPKGGVKGSPGKRMSSINRSHSTAVRNSNSEPLPKSSYSGGMANTSIWNEPGVRRPANAWQAEQDSPKQGSESSRSGLDKNAFLSLLHELESKLMGSGEVTLGAQSAHVGMALDVFLERLGDAELHDLSIQAASEFEQGLSGPPAGDPDRLVEVPGRLDAQIVGPGLPEEGGFATDFSADSFHGPLDRLGDPLNGRPDPLGGPPMDGWIDDDGLGPDLPGY